MNCLEFRRRLLQDPYQSDTDLLEHEAHCPECAQFSKTTRAQEASLRALLNQPSPPPELSENIRLGIRLERRMDSGRRVWFAAAASMMLAIGVSMLSLFEQRSEREHMALAQSVIYHIQDEADHLREPGPAAPGRVRYVLNRFGADLVGDIGPVRFAAECVMRQRTGVHLVLGGEHGPVTVFLIPGEQAGEKIPVESERFHGEIIPTRWGVLAVVGERGEAIDPIALRVADAIRWPERDDQRTARPFTSDYRAKPNDSLNLASNSSRVKT